jgi:hypothetical protein
MTSATTLLEPESNPARYVSAVLTLYLDLAETPLRASAQDQSLARRLHQQGVPLSLVESALLLASLRRLIRSADLLPLAPIRSLAYFQPVIAELQQQPLPPGYLDYVRLKLRTLRRALPADVQKTTFSGDRYHVRLASQEHGEEMLAP